MDKAKAELTRQPISIRSLKNEENWLPNKPAARVLKGHRSAVNAVSFHPSYSILASASDDATARIWDFDSGQSEKILRGHTRSVNDIDFSPDGTLFVTASSDLTLRIWDSSSCNTIKTLRGHENTVSSGKFCKPKGDRIVSASRDGSIRIWDVEQGYCLHTIYLGSDWVRCVIADGDIMVSGGHDREVKMFHGTELKHEFRGHDHVIECVVFAPPSSNRYLAGVSGQPKLKDSEKTLYFASSSRDKTIKLWSMKTGLIGTLVGHDNWVRAVVFHPEGRFLLSASDDLSIRCWDLSEPSFPCVRVLERAHNQFISCLCWGNGRILASGDMDREINIWAPIES